MTKFEFRLQRVLEWREERLRLEESRLERLYGELRALELRRAELEAARAAADRSLLHAPSAAADDLHSLQDFRDYVHYQRQLLASQNADCERRIGEQRGLVVEARRQFRLLERLRDKKLAAWEADFNRELEMQASEAFLAKFAREAG